MFSPSIFGQVLKLLPRDLVIGLIDRHHSDHWHKKFSTWDHLVAMLAGQFGQVTSLRDLETIYNTHANQHYHLGSGAVRRSTLSDANQHRDSEVFRDIALSMMSGCKGEDGELKNVISLMDSSPIKLSGRGHGWTLATRTRGNNRGRKLHVQFAPQAERIEFADVTPSNVNDVIVGRDLPVEEGRIYVFDKGYYDFNWWADINDAGATFVSRLKKNAAFKVIEERAVADERAGDILHDQVICLTNTNPGGGRRNRLAGARLRLIEIPHPGGKSTPFWIVSNNLKASADTVAGWYKQRWAVELLFKWLKQNLKIKNFLGESRNAVQIQIYVAIIAYLLLKRFHSLAGKTQSPRLKDTLVYISRNLFRRPETEIWRKRRRREQTRYQAELWPMRC